MTFDDHLAQLVEAAVARAVEPLRAEIARLRATEEDKGITKVEAAERLGVSVRTLERQIKAGAIPAVKVGGATRIPLSAVLPRG